MTVSERVNAFVGGFWVVDYLIFRFFIFIFAVCYEYQI